MLFLTFSFLLVSVYLRGAADRLRRKRKEEILPEIIAEITTIICADLDASKVHFPLLDLSGHCSNLSRALSLSSPEHTDESAGSCSGESSSWLPRESVKVSLFSKFRSTALSVSND